MAEVSFLDYLRQSASEAWDSAKSALFGDDSQQQAVGEVNRALSVLIGVRGSAAFTNVQVRAAYDLHRANIVSLVKGITAADPSWKWLVPDDVELGNFPGFTSVPRTQWHAQVQKVTVNSSGSGLNGLGVLPVIPIVVAVVAVAVGALGVTYLLTAEGRMRMDAAVKSADTAGAIAKAAIEGKLSAAEAAQILASLPKAPDVSGGVFDFLGKYATASVLGLGGLAAAAILLHKRGVVKVPGLSGDWTDEGPNNWDTGDTAFTRLLDKALAAERAAKKAGRNKEKSYPNLVARERAAKLAVRAYERSNGLPETFTDADSIPAEDDIDAAKKWVGLGALKVSTRRVDGEYVVTLRHDRRVVGRYFTSDKDDAETTKKDMLKRAEAAGTAIQKWPTVRD